MRKEKIGIRFHQLDQQWKRKTQNTVQCYTQYKKKWTVEMLKEAIGIPHVACMV